jgi:hypothetical protein
MGSITLGAVTAVLLRAADPHGAFDRWGVELGGGVAYDRYEPANALPVSSPLWLLEVRVRSPWGLSLGLLGMTASGTKDAGGYGNSLSRKMLGFDLEYAMTFPMGAIGVGRGWAGVGFAAGSTVYDHVDEPYRSEGHVREFRFRVGVDFLFFGSFAVGPWIGPAWGDTTATVYSSGDPAAPPERVSYTVFNVGGRILLVF